MNILLIRVRLWAAALGLAGAFACSDLGSEPAIEHLEVRYLSGYIFADMMPAIPPLPDDRILCFADLLVRNSSAQRLSIQFRVLRADLRRYSTRSRLGTLYFSTSWDGMLDPFATDTVRLFKRELSDDFVQPECDASVYLDIELGESEHSLIRFATDPLTFHCVY